MTNAPFFPPNAIRLVWPQKLIIPNLKTNLSYLIPLPSLKTWHLLRYCREDFRQALLFQERRVQTVHEYLADLKESPLQSYPKGQSISLPES